LMGASSVFHRVYISFGSTTSDLYNLVMPLFLFAGNE
jgi:hypothetical protein